MSKTILCYGDSNTYGYDSQPYMGDRFPKNRRWTGILDDMPEYRIINQGVPGRKLPDSNWDRSFVGRMIEEAGDFDLMTIMLGTNDLMLADQPSLPPVIRRMDQLLAYLTDSCQLPARKLLLMAPPPLKREHVEALSRDLGPQYRRLAEKYGIGFVNTADWNLALAADGAHLTEHSHRLFAEHMIKLLKSI